MSKTAASHSFISRFLSLALGRRHNYGISGVTGKSHSETSLFKGFFFFLSRPTFCYSALPHWSFVIGESFTQFPRVLPKGISFSLSKKANIVDLICSQPAVLRRRTHIPRFYPCPSSCLLRGPGGQALKMDTKGGPLTQLRRCCRFRSSASLQQHGPAATFPCRQLEFWMPLKEMTSVMTGSSFSFLTPSSLKLKQFKNELQI